MDPRAEIASLLCKTLDEAHLPWAITHGAESFPTGVGRDFDILLPVRFHARAVAIVEDAAARHGWTSCLLPLRWAGASIFLWKHTLTTLNCFEMHFIDRIDWAGCILADGTDIGSAPIKIRGLSIATWPAFAKRVLTQILSGCWDRIMERPEAFIIKPHETPHLAGPMARLFGRDAGHRLLELIRCRKLDEIRRTAPFYRVRLIMRAFLPGSGVRISAPWLTGKLARMFGIADWLPPCLFVVRHPNTYESFESLIAEVTAQLGFGKSHVLPIVAPRAIGHWRERWQVHRARSLFQLVILPLDSTKDPYSEIVNRVGRRAFETGLTVIEDVTFTISTQISESPLNHALRSFALEASVRSAAVANAYMCQLKVNSY
jgi:hypothetical protein